MTTGRDRDCGRRGGFRQYGERDIETPAFIRRVQDLGFKLRESKRSSRSSSAGCRAFAAHSCHKELGNQDAHCPILQDGDAQKEEGHR
jgi:DNA-binding transcriptional MerR regulator